jgi:hypothetical protein
MNGRLRGDRGSTAIELPLAIGLILLPISILVMVIPQWPERQTVATAAAKEAATLYANADGPDEGAAAAQAAVTQAAANYGLPSMRLELDGTWCRGCTVTANVTVDIPAIQVPIIGEVGGVSWTATSSSRVEDYASIDDAP